MGDHDRLRSPGCSAGEQEQRELGLPLSRLELWLDITSRLGEPLLDELADGDMKVTRDTVEERDSVIADTCLPRGF